MQPKQSERQLAKIVAVRPMREFPSAAEISMACLRIGEAAMVLGVFIGFAPSVNDETS
jgi:hypothetical protein